MNIEQNNKSIDSADFFAKYLPDLAVPYIFQLTHLAQLDQPEQISYNPQLHRMYAPNLVKSNETLALKYAKKKNDFTELIDIYLLRL